LKALPLTCGNSIPIISGILNNPVSSEVGAYTLATPQHSLPLDCYVILHIRSGPPYPDPNKTPAIAADIPFQLSSDVWIERFDEDFAIRIQQACEPANHLIDNFVRDRHHYAFVRREPESERLRLPGTIVRDEGIIPLFTVMALSRLIRPTTIGNRYCAKIYSGPETDPPIQALTTSGVNPDVTIGDTAHDWLSPSDGDELRKLMRWAPAGERMFKRIHHAFWKHEDAMRTYFLDGRLPAVVAGLEALVTVEKYRAGSRFVRRVRKLAREIGINLSERELEQAYELRSELAHGRSFLFDLHKVLPPDEQPRLYIKLESLLRAAVRRCLLDEEFGRHFADDQAVLKNYP
jgi:hypothetical protein